MNGKTAVIVGAGDFTDRELREPYDLLVAADGGLAPLEERGLKPDVIIGDFDSLGYVPEEAAGAGEKAPDVFALPCEKDDTDMEAACRLAWERGCRTLRVYGASGSRPDHFLGNLQMLTQYSEAGGEVSLVAPDFTVYFVTDREILLRREPGTVFSVFSVHERAEGVSISGGAKYPLDHEEMTAAGTRGVSNEFTEGEVRLSVEKGTLLVLVYRDPDSAC